MVNFRFLTLFTLLLKEDFFLVPHDRVPQGVDTLHFMKPVNQYMWESQDVLSITLPLPQQLSPTLESVIMEN